MTTRPIGRVLLCAALLALAGERLGAGDNSADKAIRDLVATYTRAVDAADTRMAGTVWSTTPDVSFIHPLGHARGWEEVQRFFADVMGGMFSERKLTVRDVVVNAYGDAAWVEFYWTFDAKLRKEGTPISTAGRETQVYRRTADGWRLVHVHYSGMPVTPGAQGQGF